MLSFARWSLPLNTIRTERQLDTKQAALIVHGGKADVIAAIRHDEEILNVGRRGILCIGPQYNLLIRPMDAVCTFGKSLYPFGMPVAG